MAKVSYRPNKKGKTEKKHHEPIHQENYEPETYQEPEPVNTYEDDVNDFYYQEEKVTPQESKVDYQENKVEDTSRIAIAGNRKNQHKLDSTKVVGDLDCEYHVYVEDYVYTYLYQLAAVDLTKESSALLIGEVYNDSKEAIVRAAIPVNMDKLEEGAEWIDINSAVEIEEMRKIYFPNSDIIGWMHMQPGYGTMLTMKELREHQSVFEGNGTICMLVDAINKIETIFVYEEEELKEQSGYCMFYERNEEMQRFMLDHPFNPVPKEETKDAVVNQFREIGKARKAEYKQRRTLNLTVMAASVILIALTAVIVKMNEGDTFIDTLKPTVDTTKDVASLDLSDYDKKVDLDAVVGEDSTDVTVDKDDLFVPDTNLDDLFTSETNLDDLFAPEKTNDMDADQMVDKEDTVTTSDDVDTNEPVDVPTTNEVVPEEKNTEAVATTDEEYNTYVVKSGDTLADICYREYGDAKKSLEVAKINGLSSTNQITVGQELKMPK